MSCEQYDEAFFADASPHLKWCMEHKSAILALHSSAIETNIFAVECTRCQRWFKHCMFSNSERKKDSPSCRWCRADIGIGIDNQQFEIQHHIHCNRKEKECQSYYPLSLELPPNRRESMINTVSAPETQFTVKKKMTQKERKAALRTEKMDKETGGEEKKWSIKPAPAYPSFSW